MTLRALSAWIHVRNVSSPIDPLTLSNILIIRTDAIGDMVLSTAIWRVIKKHYPHMNIGVVGSFRNLSVIANDSDVNMTFELADMKPRTVLRLARKIKATNWDLVIPLTYNRKTKMAILSKLFAPKGIASMVLFRDDPVEHYNQLFSVVVQSGMLMDKQPILDLMKTHLDGTLAMHISDEEWRPSLHPKESAVLRIKSEIEETMRSDKTSGFVHINLEARTPFRELGIENSFELSQKIRSRFGDMSVLWTASPASSAAVETFLASNSSYGIHFQRTQNIDELIGLVRQATLVITPDTSVVHIASAERKPVVALLRHYSEWHPYKVPHYVLVPSFGEAVSTIPQEIILEALENLMDQRRAHTFSGSSAR